MLLKRKRSDDELSFSSGTVFSSSLRSDSDTIMMDLDTPLSPRTLMSCSRSSTPSHLNSRTMKRFRNGRPSDVEVHQHTLSILYQAQQQPSQPQHVLSLPPTQSPTPMPLPLPQAQAAPVQNQPSLHSFWKIPSTSASVSSASTRSLSAASASSLPSVMDEVNRPSSCEDCGVGLNGEDAMMDDGYGFEAFIHTCSACARPVCFSCSVSNLGEQRRCLLCAGSEKKVWVGGVGWRVAGVALH